MDCYCSSDKGGWLAVFDTITTIDRLADLNFTIEYARGDCEWLHQEWEELYRRVDYLRYCRNLHYPSSVAKELEAIMERLRDQCAVEAPDWCSWFEEGPQTIAVAA